MPLSSADARWRRTFYQLAHRLQIEHVRPHERDYAKAARRRGVSPYQVARELGWYTDYYAKQDLEIEADRPIYHEDGQRCPRSEK